MNRDILLLALLLIVISVALGSCGGEQKNNSVNLPSDPSEAMKRIAQAAAEIQSAHFTLDINIGLNASGQPQGMKMTAWGELEVIGSTPQDANMQMEVVMSSRGHDFEMEMVTLGGEYWVREVGQDWLKSAAASANLASGLGGDPTAALLYLQHAQDVKKKPDERIDGIDCYHFAFTLDSESFDTLKVFEQFSGNGELTDEQVHEMLKTASLCGEVWVGKQDLYPRREQITITFQVSGLPDWEDMVVNFDMQMHLGFNKINEPVEIQAPSSWSEIEWDARASN